MWTRDICAFLKITLNTNIPNFSEMQSGNIHEKIVYEYAGAGGQLQSRFAVLTWVPAKLLAGSPASKKSAKPIHLMTSNYSR